MARTDAAVKPTKQGTTVRMEPALLEKLEKYRDPERFPTQSDFIREAVRRMIREERRNQVRERMKEWARDPEKVAFSQEMANWGIEEYAERLDRIDRGEE